MAKWVAAMPAGSNRLRANPLLPKIRRRSRDLVAAFLLASLVICAGPSEPIHIRNFGQVNTTVLRGAEPSPTGLQELQSRGVKLIIDLRESGQFTLHEQQLARQLGMQYVNVPFSPFSAPEPEQLRSVLLLLLNHGNSPVFIHCRRGKDRTGTVVACYRIQHDGWDNARALSEANEYGMSYMERSMRAFILHFSPLSNSALYPTTPSISQP